MRPDPGLVRTSWSGPDIPALRLAPQINYESELNHPSSLCAAPAGGPEMKKAAHHLGGAVRRNAARDGILPSEGRCYIKGGQPIPRGLGSRGGGAFGKWTLDESPAVHRVGRCRACADAAHGPEGVPAGGPRDG